MTVQTQPPDIGTHVRRLEHRIELLERPIRRQSTGRPAPDEPLEAIFSHAGTLPTTPSPRWYPRRTARLYTVVVSLAIAGTSNTVVTVYVNGGSQGTITLASGVNKNSAAFNNVLVADTDYLTVTVTTVGTGAKDITVQGRLS